MSILEKLSSLRGEKQLIAKRAVADQYIESPLLIDEIANDIGNKNIKIAADCSEVMTMIAENKPELYSSTF